MNGLQPRTRYVCLECAVDVEYALEHWGTQLCESCWGSTRFPHLGDTGTPHLRWLCISPGGEHTILPSRPAMENAVIREVTAADLTLHPAAAADLSNGADCPACYCYEISSENPVASLPGCAVPAHRW